MCSMFILLAAYGRMLTDVRVRLLSAGIARHSQKT